MTNITQVITTVSSTPTSVEPKQFILSKEEFLPFQEAFKVKARNKQSSAVDILLYNIMRGHDKTRGFTPISNPKKLAGGEDAYGGNRRYMETVKSLRWAVEGFSRGQAPGTTATYYNLTPAQCLNILEVLK